MLQQTQVQTVIPYFEAFLQRWPTLRDLAAADETVVLKAWEGLGYYSRARNLLAAARLACELYDCSIPENENERLTLPGIGEYTAAAIGAIAFGQPVAAVDGNIVRVFARLSATAWNPADLAQRRVVRKLAVSVLPADRPGDFNEALMDLGATVCLPRQPRCRACPLTGICRALSQDRVVDFPGKPAAKPRPAENKIVLVLACEGRFHVRQRPPRGLLAGMYEFDWLDDLNGQPDAPAADALARLFPAAAVHSLGSLTHDFTHKRWLLEGYLVQLARTPAVSGGHWVSPSELQVLPFPTALAGYREKVLSDQVLIRISENPCRKCCWNGKPIRKLTAGVREESGAA